MADPEIPVGRASTRGSYVLKILYVETKESGPLRGGGRALGTPPDAGIYSVNECPIQLAIILEMKF